MKPGHPKETDSGACRTISEMLSRIGDKWTLQVVRELGDGPMRFNAIRRRIGDISQKMLSSTLRNLERDGFVTRTVTPTMPPQVEYELTELGKELRCPVAALAEWTVRNLPRIEAAREAFERRAEAE